MSENETTQKSSRNTQPRMRDGEEPTELLLALVSSPLLALLARGIANIVTGKDEDGNDVLAVIFANSHWSQSDGIVANTAGIVEELPTAA